MFEVCIREMHDSDLIRVTGYSDTYSREIAGFRRGVIGALALLGSHEAQAVRKRR